MEEKKFFMKTLVAVKKNSKRKEDQNFFLSRSYLIYGT